MSATAEADAHLAAADAVMAALVRQYGPCRLAPRPGGFESLAGMVVGQQLSRAAATTIRSRLHAALGDPLAPAALLAADEPGLRACGLSGAKIACLRGLAAATASGALDFAALDRLPDDQAVAMLTAAKGVGRWTAEMYLIFVLARPDVLPANDAALRATYCKLYDVPATEYAPRFADSAEAWRPWRSVACWYLYAAANGPGTVDVR